ncbi:MAG: hypothetical protein JWP38_1843 [Herbaspirillum sp.]|nr:hypothetical protein [Herbaspirillum sp.]
MLVVLGHLTSPLGPFIFSFHIPLFFFLGGMFIKPDDALPAFVKKNFVRLMAPYFIFATLGILVSAGKDAWFHQPAVNFSDSVSGMLIWMDHAHLLHYGYVLWFLPALFWARIFCILLNKYVKANEALTLLFLCAVSYRLAVSPGIELPFCMDEAVIAMPWVLFGRLFYRQRDKLLNMPVWMAAFMALCLCLILGLHAMPHIDMAENKIGDIWISLPYTFFMILLIVWGIYRINRQAPDLLKKIATPIALFGWQSMLVYVAHVYTNTAVHFLAARSLGNGDWYIVLPISMAILSALIWLKLRRPRYFLFRYL